jgi:hypothetical protein
LPNLWCKSRIFGLSTTTYDKVKCLVLHSAFYDTLKKTISKFK